MCFKKKYLLIIFLFVCFSCTEDNRYKLIQLDSEIEIFVKDTKNERGVLILNRSYIVSGACPLDYEIVYPDWIREDDSFFYRTKDYVFKPAICDIKPPYKLIKKKNTDFFEIIKFKDTLTFKIIEF